MKKIFMLAILMTTAIQGFAQDDYMVISLSDGKKFSVRDADVAQITLESPAPEKKNSTMPWFILGTDIADGGWSFNVGKSCLPLTIIDNYFGNQEYVGYLEGGGFKIVGPEMNWDKQIGAYGWYNWAINDGGSDNITVPYAGYWRIYWDPLNYCFDIYDLGYVPQDYGTICVSGPFNDWGDTEMTPSRQTNNHDWYTYISGPTELKFKQAGSWENNWGYNGFSGIAETNGENIQIPEGDWIVVFNDIDKGYTIWNQDYSKNYYNRNEASATYDLDVTGGYSVDFAEQQDEMVKMFDSHLNLIPEHGDSYSVSYNGMSIAATPDGYVFAEDLKNLIVSNFGKAREQHEMQFEVIDEVNVNNNTIQYKGTVNFSAILEEPTLPSNPYLYCLGSTEGWWNYGQKLALTNPEEGIYTGYLYLTGNPDLAFKLLYDGDDWGTQITANNFHTYNGDATTKWEENFSVSSGDGVYYVEVNPAVGSYSATKVNQMSIIGDFNSWGDDVDMTWDADNYCFVAENPGITANGWKFRVNHSWELNLGGDNVYELVANGNNLTSTGSTVKLYPCRVQTPNIFCTVE